MNLSAWSGTSWEFCLPRRKCYSLSRASFNISPSPTVKPSCWGPWTWPASSAWPQGNRLWVARSHLQSHVLLCLLFLSTFLTFSGGPQTSWPRASLLHAALHLFLPSQSSSRCSQWLMQCLSPPEGRDLPVSFTAVAPGHLAGPQWVLLPRM